MWHDLLLETRASPRLTQCGHKITDLQIYIYIYIYILNQLILITQIKLLNTLS